MLDPKIEDKLERIRELYAQREEIDAELQSLLGGGSHVARASSKPGALIKKVKGQRLCSVCQKPGHNSKTCDSNQAPSAPELHQNSESISEDQFDEVKHLQKTGGLISRDFAEERGVGLREVNLAIMSRTYDEYLRKRMQKD